MKHYHLIISQNAKTERLILDTKKPTKLKAKANTRYQIVDDEGVLADDVRFEWVGDDLYAYLPNDTEVALIIEDSDDYLALLDTGSSFHTATLDMLANHSPAVIGTAGSKGLWLGLGAVGLGVGMASAKGGKDNHTPNTNTPSTPPTPPAPEKIPTIKFNDITDDNIINHAESQGNITITGEVNDSKNGDVLNIVIGNNPPKTVAIEQGKFSLTVAGNVLVDKPAISAHIVRNGTKLDNTETPLTYQVDTDIAKPVIKFDPITEDNAINLAESTEPNVKITGKVENFHQGDKVSIKIGQADPVQVAIQADGTFSLNVAGQTLAQKPTITASLTTTDNAGNTATGEAIANYTVNLTDPNLTIDLNPIGRIASNQDLTVSGKVTGKFNTTDKVTLKIGSHTVDNIAINSDGAFTTIVPKDKLAGNTSIQAQLISRDVFGNAKTVSDSETYSFATTNDFELSLASISGDNHINVTEKSQKVSVTGKITGNDANTQIGKTVSTTVNGKDYTATIKNDLTFEFKVDGEDLIKHNGYKLTASLTNNGHTISSPEIEYKVAPDAIAKIHLDDVNLGLAEEIGHVRLSGKLDFANSDSIYKWGHNKDFIQTIILKIGDQEISTGILQSDYSFYVDLSHEQYQSLKGQEISYKLKATGDYGNWLPYFTYKNNTPTHFVDIADQNSEYAQKELAKIQVVFNNSTIQSTKQLNFDIDTKTEISGRVEGVEVGDEISIQVGTQTYQTIVKNDLSFSVQVDNTSLNNLAKIQAHLKTNNAKGETITVSDVGHVLQNTDVSSILANTHESISPADRVIQHTDPNYNFPYFIHAHIPNNTEFAGFLNNIPFGGVGEPATIKYYFVKVSDYDNGLEKPVNVKTETLRDYAEDEKEMIHDIYRQYERVTNVKFQETDNINEAHTVFKLGEHISDGIGGYAFHGGSVFMNSHFLSQNRKTEFYYAALHEILHTLGTEHFFEYTPDFVKHEGKLENKGIGSGELSNMNLWGKENVLRVYDLAYLHYRFGINPNHKTGNDVYRFKHYNANTSDADIYIWDANGVDTFDASGEQQGVNIDLTPGSWIYRGEKSDVFAVKDKVRINEFGEVNKFFPEFSNVNFIGNVNFTHDKTTYTEGQAFIGYGTQLENLIGSAHADTLAGNKADNNIFGGDGNDAIHGDDGNDYLDGGKGVDTLYGGAGNDIFLVDNVADQVIETAGSDIDTIYAHVDYRLTDFVENLSLFGNALNSTGNALDNTIQGNDFNNTLNGEAGNDRLNGGRGSDTLSGGAGNDVFVFGDLLDGAVDTITDFGIGEDKIELSSSIFLGLTANNLSEHIKYDKNTGRLSYDPDGSNNADAIVFAVLENKADLSIDTTHFTII